MCSCARQAFSQRLKFGHQVRFFAIKLSEITWCVFFEFLLKLQSTVSSHDGIDFLPKVGNFLSLLIIHNFLDGGGDCENTKIIFIFIIKFIYYKIIFITVISFYLYLCNRFLLPRKRRKIGKQSPEQNQLMDLKLHLERSL